MAHKVKCPICGQYFDRDTVPCVKYSATRYAHKDCYPNGEEVKVAAPADNGEYRALTDYIKSLLKDKADWAVIGNQIKKFKEEYGYTYSGILGSLIWWYEIQNNELREDTCHIAFVPYIYNSAKNYFESIERAKQTNAAKDIKRFIPKVQHITIKPPKGEIACHRLFNMEDEE